MKKGLSLLVVFLCLMVANLSFGQSTSATTTLKVVLSEAFNISVSNATAGTITFSTIANYTAASGLTATVNDHLSVSSNRSFSITAKITSITGVDEGANRLAASNVKILASDGTTSNGSVYNAEQTFAGVNTGVTIINNAAGTIVGSTNTQKKFNVKYTVFDVGDKDLGDYDVNLEYTVAAP